MTTEHYADFALMLGFIPAESAEVPRLLEEIANDIYLHGKSDEFENVSPKDGMEWLDVNCISAMRLINDFLRKHGHRSLKEVIEKSPSQCKNQVVECLHKPHHLK